MFFAEKKKKKQEREGILKCLFLLMSYRRLTLEFKWPNLNKPNRPKPAQILIYFLFDKDIPPQDLYKMTLVASLSLSRKKVGE